MGKARKHRTNFSWKQASHPYKRNRRPSVSSHLHAQLNQTVPPPARSSSTTARHRYQQQQQQQQQNLQQNPPFHVDDRILLVGEGRVQLYFHNVDCRRADLDQGDFSFTLSLHKHYGCTSLTATTLESRPSLIEKYPQAASYISEIEEAGHNVLYNIDAARLGHRHTHGAASLRKSLFDTIFFNFPHVGGKSTNVNRQVRSNQELIVKFLENAMNLLASSGKILLTIFEGEPYDLWGVRNLARHVGLKVERSMKFIALMYPDYKHVRTLGNVEGNSGWKGEERDSRMFVFKKNEEIKDKDKSSLLITGGQRDEGGDGEYEQHW